MQRWRSLRVRLTLWIILATVIPFAALMRLAVHFKGEAVVAVALGDLSRLARTKSDSIDNWLAARRAELASLSRDSSNEHQVSDETARRLQRLDSDRPSFAGIVAIGPDGTVVSSRPRTAADAGETTASLLDAAKRNPDGFSVTPTPGSSADVIALLAIRWPHHGRAQGVLAARLDGLEALLAGKAPG
jgi:hypothetical protein